MKGPEYRTEPCASFGIPLAAGQWMRAIVRPIQHQQACPGNQRAKIARIANSTLARLVSIDSISLHTLQERRTPVARTASAIALSGKSNGSCAGSHTQNSYCAHAAIPTPVKIVARKMMAAIKEPL